MRSYLACLLEFLPCTSVNQIISVVSFHNAPEKLVMMFASHHITPDSTWIPLSGIRKEYLGMSGNTPSVPLHKRV